MNDEDSLQGGGGDGVRLGDLFVKSSFNEYRKMKKSEETSQSRRDPRMIRCPSSDGLLKISSKTSVFALRMLQTGKSPILSLESLKTRFFALLEGLGDVPERADAVIRRCLLTFDRRYALLADVIPSTLRKTPISSS